MGIPVFGLLGESSDYSMGVIEKVAGQNIKNWTHPFVEGLCDQVFTSLFDLCSRVSQLLGSVGLASVYREKTDSSIKYFLETNGSGVSFHDQ